ncbi:MAG: 2-phosphosulfolactate phosphatase family protein [Clostridiales bacterium]|nr:2-phosphosulfolactate phosphatase family protein [Clostridiales bacterium]
MKIDIVISANYINEDIIKDKVVVVIDVFRATSVITTAINNGCKSITPVLTIEEALKIKKDKPFVLLGGERKGLKIEGFDFSNSPLEYNKKNVSGKEIVFTTTNGTRALTKCTAAEKILIGAMINGKAVADKLMEINKDVVIVNAGTNGNFSIDDFICSGYIISEIINKKDNVELTDIARLAYIDYNKEDNVISYMSQARHYKYMMTIDLQDDIQYCIQKNIMNVVPEYNNEIIE